MDSLAVDSEVSRRDWALLSWLSLRLSVSVTTLKNVYPWVLKFIILLVQKSLGLFTNERKAKLIDSGGRGYK